MFSIKYLHRKIKISWCSVQNITVKMVIINCKMGWAGVTLYSKKRWKYNSWTKNKLFQQFFPFTLERRVTEKSSKNIQKMNEGPDLYTIWTLFGHLITLPPKTSHEFADYYANCHPASGWGITKNKKKYSHQ